MVVSTEHGDGVVTSGVFSPSLQRGVALVRIPAAVAIGETVQVVVRNKQLPAVTMAPPFVRSGRSFVADCPIVEA